MKSVPILYYVLYVLPILHVGRYGRLLVYAECRRYIIKVNVNFIWELQFDGRLK